MLEPLISKKELLEPAGISYGQLYRWKRKNLILEDWFTRKSTFTGQETFFLRDKVLSRVDQIKNMKDDLSLDELANVFSPNLYDISVPISDVVERNIVSSVALDLFKTHHKDVQVLLFVHLLHIYVMDAALQLGDISRDEGHIVLLVIEHHGAKFPDNNFDVVIVRKLGSTTCLLVSGSTEWFVGSGAKVVARMSIA